MIMKQQKMPVLIIYELDFQAIEEYADEYPKTELVMNTIRMEVL